MTEVEKSALAIMEMVVWKSPPKKRGDDCEESPTTHDLVRFMDEEKEYICGKHITRRLSLRRERYQ
jgi:hypothetical protein